MQVGSKAFRSRLVLQVTGDFRREALEQAVRCSVDRHEALRASFVSAPNGEAFLTVSELSVLLFREIDLGPVGIEGERSVLERILAAETQQFDLSRGPLFHATIFALGESRWALKLSLPTLLGDGAALRSIAREIGNDLAGHAADPPPGGEPTDAPLQLNAFSEWQHDILSDASGREGVEYWRTRFDTVERVLSLPSERQVAEESGFRFDGCAVSLESSFVQEISDAAARYGVGLEAYLLACWSLLIGRAAMRSRLTIGTGFDGRVSKELTDCVGLFARYLPIECDLAEERSFGAVLRATQAALHGASQWQEYGLWPVAVDATGWRGDHAFFPIAFDFENVVGEWHVANASFRILEQSSCCDRFGIRLRCAGAGDALTATVDYDGDCFEPGWIRQIAFAYVTILGKAMRNVAVRELGLLDPFQRHCLLNEFNDTRVSFADCGNVCEWLEAQVRCTPDRVALVCADRQLTYSALDTRTSQIAAYLAQSGVTAEARVGVFIDQMLEAVIALWAVLKSGGAYVPIDPTYPMQRISYILEDAQVHLLLTCRSLLSKLPANIPVICVEDIDHDTEGLRAGDTAARAIVPENAAYVIYTSGSTGQPKGAVVSHRNLVQSTFARFERYPEPVTKFLLVSSLAFDSSCAGLFWTLCGGGALVFPGEGREKDALHLSQLISEQRVTHILCVPFLYKYILSGGREHDSHSLQTAIVAGDAFGEDLVALHRHALPATALYNEYGVTEASVWSTVSGDLGKVSSGSRVSVGRPVANTRVYLLDAQFEPVAKGVAGELYLAGDGVCRGYLDRPGLTAEMFLPDPYCAEPGARMYRTRDIARYLPTEDVELLGRGDEQVKLHGYRIELKEIEHVLAKHPGVEDAVVLVREGRLLGSHLVAYVCPAQGAALVPEQVRAFVVDLVPSYMVPSSIIVLHRMPLTPHGKVDRNGLRHVDGGVLEQGTGSDLPRNAIENILVRIWSEVLGLPSVGVHDHFLECGGDSILSIQVVSRARREGLQLMPAQIFEHPTIAELAAVVETARMVSAEQGVIAGGIPLTPIQRWFFEHAPANPNYFNQALMLQVREPVGLALLQQALDALVMHHDALRLRFTHTSSGWEQENVASRLAVPLVSIDLSKRTGEAFLDAILADAGQLQASLDLGRPSLVRAATFAVGEGEGQLLLLIVHHLLVDAVSWRILAEDLETCLECLLQGRPIVLPAKTTSYKAWSERLCAFARTDPVERELAYWSSPARLCSSRLKPDFPNGANLEAAGRVIAGSLSQDESKALFARLREVSINEALLTALVSAFSTWTGISSLFLNLEGHGREQLFDGVDISRTVGWFSTIFPMRFELALGDGPAAQMMSIKRQLAEVPKHGIHYGILRYLSGDAIAAAIQAIPAPEVSFNYLGRIDNAWPGSGLLGLAQQTIGPTRDPGSERRHLIDVTAQVAGGELQYAFNYASAQFLPATIQRVADRFDASLRTFFQADRPEAAKRPTPAEFPLIKSTQAQLDRLMAKFDTNLQE